MSTHGESELRNRGAAREADLELFFEGEVGVPGKRAPTAGMAAPDEDQRARNSLALARADLGVARTDHLPRLRDAIAARSMPAARTAAEMLASALERIACVLDEAGQEGDAVAELAAARDALAEEAAPHLALAPPPAPPLSGTPWALAYAPPSAETVDAGQANEARWHQRLDDHDAMRAPVQRKAADTASTPRDIQEIAAAGVEGACGPLPHHDEIQRGLGRHDVSGVRAQVGGPAAGATAAIGAVAYATGDRVAFAAPPSLHTAAHEAAHTVQQRRGVQLSGGVGTAGDPYEHQADAVADAVVAGQSAEAILDGLPGGAPAGGVQRKELSAPRTSREVEVVVFERGAASLVVRVLNTMGETGAAGGEGEDVGPIDRATWSALEPTMVTEANSFGLRLEAALIKSEFSIEAFEGLDFALELTGPEGSFDLENGGDLSLAQIELKGVADLMKLGGLQAPAGKSFKVEVSGTFTIGGKLLAKLAEMAARAGVIAGKADELGRIADDLAKAEALDKDLAKRRKALILRRDALPWEIRGTRADLDAKIGALDLEIAENRARIHAGAARAGSLQRELADEAKKLTALERKLDGKIARKLAGRITKAAAKKIAAAVARLVPILNLMSTISDIVSVLQLFVEWAEHDFDLPEPGSAGPFGEISWDDGPDGDAPRPGEDDDASTEGSGESETGSKVDGAGGGDAADDGAPQRERARSRRKAEAGGDVPVSVPDQLHRHAKAVLDVIERKGVPFDEAQVRALEQIVPSTLTDDQAVQLLQALISQGESLGAGQDAHDVLAAVDQAVRDLSGSTMRVRVDGQDRPDLAAQSGGREEEADALATEDVHGDRGDGDAASQDGAYDLATVVEKLPESVVESWLAVRRGLDTSGFDAWRDENLGAAIPGKNDWQLNEANLVAENASRGGRWSVQVVFEVNTATRLRVIEHHFFVDLDADGRPVAERIHMFTVRP